VTFNAKGGTFLVNGKAVAVNTITVQQGASIGSLPKPTRENYKFAGWYYVEQKTNKKVSSGVTVNGEVTLLADWQRIAYVKSKTKAITQTLPKQKTKSLKKGKKIYIINKAGKYYKIQLGQKTGFVLKKDVTLQSTKAVKKTAWLMKKASSDSKKLVKVVKGGKLTVIGVSGKYYQVKYKSGNKTFKGFILKKYTKKAPASMYAKAAA
jgi:uncharacterized repeat protein (TIGR02543 family)